MMQNNFAHKPQIKSLCIFASIVGIDFRSFFRKQGWLSKAIIYPVDLCVILLWWDNMQLWEFRAGTILIVAKDSIIETYQ